MSELAKIHQGRITARADAKNVSSEERHILELQFIADSLEALRVQIAGLSQLVGAALTQQK
jgi:hypothetical protein